MVWAGWSQSQGNALNVLTPHLQAVNAVIMKSSHTGNEMSGSQQWAIILITVMSSEFLLVKVFYWEHYCEIITWDKEVS